MSGNPQPMTMEAMNAMADPLDYEDARLAMRQQIQIIRAAEQFIPRQIDAAAEAEGEYRKALRSAVIRLRADGKGATEAETLAKGDPEVVTYQKARDVAHGMIRFYHEVLENRRGDRASLHKVVDYSMKTMGQVLPPENVPVIGGSRSA